MSKRGSSSTGKSSPAVTEITELTDADAKGGKEKQSPSSPRTDNSAGTMDSLISRGAPSFQKKFWEATRKARKQLKRAKATSQDAYQKERSKVLLKATPRQWKSKSARAKTAFPVDKLKERLRMAMPSHVTVTTEAAVAFAAGLDYCVSELLDVSSKAADLKRQGKITPRHIKLGVPQDESLAELFGNVTIPQGGVVPRFHPELAMGYRKPSTKRPVMSEGKQKDAKGSSPVTGSPSSMKDKGDISSLNRTKKKKDSSPSSEPPNMAK